MGKGRGDYRGDRIEGLREEGKGGQKGGSKRATIGKPREEPRELLKPLYGLVRIHTRPPVRTYAYVRCTLSNKKAPVSQRLQAGLHL